MKKILCIIVGMLCLLPLGAKVKLPAIIGNDMVLQQNTNVNLWGWATRSRKITVRTSIIRKSKFPQNPKRSVRFSGKRTKRSVQKRKARNTQKAETKVL